MAVFDVAPKGTPQEKKGNLPADFLEWEKGRLYALKKEIVVAQAPRTSPKKTRALFKQFEGSKLQYEVDSFIREAKKLGINLDPETFATELNRRLLDQVQTMEISGNKLSKIAKKLRQEKLPFDGKALVDDLNNLSKHSYRRSVDNFIEREELREGWAEAIERELFLMHNGRNSLKKALETAGKAKKKGYDLDVKKINEAIAYMQRAYDRDPQAYHREHRIDQRTIDEFRREMDKLTRGMY